MTSRFVSVLTGLLFAVPALAQIRVDYREGSNWVNLNQSPAGSNIAITDVGSRTYRVYTLSPATQSIGALSIASAAGATPVLFVGTGLTQPSETISLTPGALNVGAVTYTGGRPRLQLSVNEGITGEIDFWHIVRLDFGGTLTRNVTHDPVDFPGPTPPRLGAIQAIQIGHPSSTVTIVAKRGDIGRITSTYDNFASIECSTGSIAHIEAAVGLVGGNIGGKQIQALNGSIGDVITLLGRIGAGVDANQPITIRARNGVNLIRTGGILNANITANANGGSGAIGAIETGSEIFDGHFFGTITASRATGLPGRDAIYFSGDCRGDILISGDLTGDICILRDLQISRTISIGGALTSSAVISIASQSDPGAQHLAGQIIINANNAGRTWSPSAPIRLSPSQFALAPVPLYSNLPASIGGGSVGEAPFNVHAAACTPAHGSLTTPAAFPDTVVVRHYGPVFTLGSTPLRVFARPIDSLGGSWTDYTSNYTFIVGVSNNRRNVSISRIEGGLGWAPGYEFLITPVTDLTSANALRCLDVLNKPAVRSYQYSFRIGDVPP